MRNAKWVMVATLVVAVGTLSVVLATGAFAVSKHHHVHPGHHGKHTGAPLIDASLAPSQTGDPMLHGVNPGAKSWVLRRGTVLLTRRGKLNLRVTGFMVSGAGTGPVSTISASLYCGADTTTAAAGTTQQVPLSSKGDAVIHGTTFKVRSICLAPVILVHPNGAMSSYVAVSGWRR